MTDKYTIVYNQLPSCLEAVNIICFSLIWVCVCVFVMVEVQLMRHFLNVKPCVITWPWLTWCTVCGCYLNPPKRVYFWSCTCVWDQICQHVHVHSLGVNLPPGVWVVILPVYRRRTVSDSPDAQRVLPYHQVFESLFYLCTGGPWVTHLMHSLGVTSPPGVWTVILPVHRRRTMSGGTWPCPTKWRV